MQIIGVVFQDLKNIIYLFFILFLFIDFLLSKVKEMTDVVNIEYMLPFIGIVLLTFSSFYLCCKKLYILRIENRENENIENEIIQITNNQIIEKSIIINTISSFGHIIKNQNFKLLGTLIKKNTL